MSPITFTESRPTEVLANLHHSAAEEQEYLREMSEAGYRVPPPEDVASVFEEKMLALVSVLVCALVLVVGKVIKIDRASQEKH